MKGEGLNDFEVDVLKRLETLDRSQDVFFIMAYLLLIAILLQLQFSDSIFSEFQKIALVLVGFVLLFLFYGKSIFFILWLLEGKPVKLKIRGGE